VAVTETKIINQLLGKTADEKIASSIQKGKVSGHTFLFQLLRDFGGFVN